MYIYILKCSNGKYYTGRTKNLAERLHNHSRGSQYTKRAGIDKLVYVEEIQDNQAFHRENSMLIPS